MHLYCWQRYKGVHVAVFEQLPHTQCSCYVAAEREQSSSVVLWTTPSSAACEHNNHVMTHDILMSQHMIS
jgi:hypothetical protein